MFPERSHLHRARGFSLAAAIFLLVILAALGVFIMRIAAYQHVGSALDLQGARAYQAARAGIESAAFAVLRPAVAPSDCPATYALAFPAGSSLAEFSTTVSCVHGKFMENGVNHFTYRFTATACNQPSCPAAAPGANYVERQISVVLSR